MSPPFDGYLKSKGRMRGTPPSAPPFRRKLLFEALEPRLLLSADSASPAVADMLASAVNQHDQNLNSTLYQQLDTSSSAVLVALTLQDVQDDADATAKTWIIEDHVPFPADATRELAPGADLVALVASDATDNVWRITGADQGTLNDVPFSGVNVLIGGADNNDTFIFEPGGSLSGFLDGGAGGNDTLDYSASASAVYVDLAVAKATGVSRFGNIDQVIGGSAADTLKGPAQDSAWTISGANSGNVGSVSFSSFENLEGAADNVDSFDFYAAGSISGVVDGGAGGNDSLSLVDGVFDLVTYTIVDPETGTIARDADLITFRGLEPATDSTPGAKDVTDLWGSTDILVSAADDPAIGPGPLTVSGDHFPESFVFTNATSLTLNAGDNANRITIRGTNADLPGFTINAGGGDDVIVFEGTAPVEGFAFHGGAGQDTIVFSSDAALTLTDSGLLQNSIGGLGSPLDQIERAVIEAPSLATHYDFTGGNWTGELIFTSGVPDWVSQGPGPYLGGSTTNIPNSPVSGAIHEVVLNPFDLSSLYVGTANGGVWKNSDISVLFDFALTTLTATAQARLDAFAGFLKSNPTLSVNIVGHTDDVGDNDTVNVPLSQTRALTVKNYLISKGVDASRLTDSGQGETNPVATNTTDAGRALNRRVELIVNHWIPLTDQFPSLAISALTISPFDADGIAVTGSTPVSKFVIYAGTGAVTSGAALFSGIGQASAIGILKSTDGGTTWNLLDSLKGGKINAIKVLPSGDLLVGTDAANGSGTGLFRSTDGGQSFIDVTAVTGTFPAAAVTDIALDPGAPLRAYAAVAGNGVFITEDGGASWNAINNGLTNLATSTRLILSVSDAIDPDTLKHPVYVATIGKVNTLTAGSAQGSLTIQVTANTVVEPGDLIGLGGAGSDGVDNDADGLIDGLDPSEANLTEQWKVATVGAIAGGNRTVTLTPANADKIDNDRNGTVDTGAETAVAGQGLFNAWGAGATVTYKPGFGSQRLTGIFRTDTNGVTWTAMPLPGTNETNGFVGVNTGGQAKNHFSMAADPTNPDVVWVGGDTQPVAPFTGRLFVGNAASGTWAPIVQAGASGTAPHADSRDLVFRGLHLLEVDDGGIYQLRNVASPGRAWESLNADLSLTQFTNIAYDPIFDVILGGAQDNGVPLQSATGSTTWNGIGGGDGGIVQFSSRMDDSGTILFPSSTVYSAQSLLSFVIHRTPVLDAAAAGSPSIRVGAGTPVVLNDRIVVGGFFQTVTSITPQPDGSLVLAIQGNLLGNVNAGDIMQIRPLLSVGGQPLSSVDTPLFVNPLVLNAINPNNLLLGTHSVYESTNMGRTLTRLLSISGNSNIGEVKPLIYGGRQPDGLGGFTDTPSVIYVGTDPGESPAPAPADNHALWLRQANVPIGGNLSPVTTYTTEVGVAVVDIAVDPKDWHNVWVLDANGNIWFSPNAGQTKVFNAGGDPGSTNAWKQLTENLPLLPGTKLLQQIAVAKYHLSGISPTPVVTVLLVGGEGGVYRKIDDGPWHEFGEGLPNAMATGLEYMGGIDNLVLAGTFGRGAWTIPDARSKLDVPSVLTITGSAGNDVFVLERNATHPWLLDVYQFLEGELQPALPSFSVPYLSLTSININGGLGNDRFVIDPAAGAIFAGTITVAGGGGSDTLELHSPTDPLDVMYDSGVVGTPTVGSQVSVLTDVFGDIVTQTVSWTGMTFIDDSSLTGVQVASNVVGSGLDILADAFTASMTNALASTTLPGIDARSLAAALNGLKIDSATPESSPFITTSQVPGSDLVQVDNGKSVLLRILEAGGINVSDIISGTIPDANALKDALEAIDGDPGNNSAQLFTTDQSFDADSDPDLLYQVTAQGIVLTGVLDLDVASSVLGGIGDVALTGQVDVTITLDLSLAFGVDSKGFFVRTGGPVLPTLTITGLTISGEAVGTGQLGFLGVDVNSATLALDDGVHLVFSLNDPGTEAADSLIRAPELLTNDTAGLISFQAITDGDGTPDLVLDAQVTVSALLPGVPSGISLATAGVKLAWADITVPGQVAVSAGAVPGSDIADLLNFLQVDVQEVLDQIKQLDQLADALDGFDLPLLQGTLSGLSEAATFISDNIIDPLTGGVSGEANFGTIQNLVVRLAHAAGVDPAALGLDYDSVTKELTWHLDLSKNFVATDTLDLGFDLENGLADLDLNAAGNIAGSLGFDFTVGIDVGAIVAGDSPDEWFFLRDASAAATIDLEASGINASARFGFLSLGIEGGTAEAEAGILVTLNDPGTHANDGRIDLGELLDGLADLGNFVDFDLTGLDSDGNAAPGTHPNLSLSLPLVIPFLDVALEDNQVIDILWADLTDPESIAVSLPTGLLDVLPDFTNMDAGTFVSLLGNVTTWLEDFRHSFNAESIPLVGPALDDALKFSDLFKKTLLFDDGGDGVDGADKLITDINAALASAGLGEKIAAEAKDGKVSLFAIAPGVTSFSVSGNGLGYGAVRSAAMSQGRFELDGTSDAPANGVLGSDVTFNIAINGAAAVAVSVTAASTSANTGRGNDKRKLLDKDNRPTFDTVQQLVGRLINILGAGDYVTYHAADDPLTAVDETDTITFDLALGDVNSSTNFGVLDLPIQFDLLQDLGAVAEISSNSHIQLSAGGGLTLTLGLYIGNTGGIVLSDSTELTTLRNGIFIPAVEGDPIFSQARVIAAPNEVATTYGRLSGDAKFKLSINGGPEQEIVIDNDDTETNASVDDLVTDINNALTAAGVASQVSAVRATGTSGPVNKINLVAGSGVTSLALTAQNGDPAITQIGFRGSMTAQPDAADGNKLKIKGEGDVSGLIGRLTGDAVLQVNLNGAPGVPVTITAANTSTNRNILDVVVDVQRALDAAGFENKIEVTSLGKRLIFKTLEAGVTSFNITVAGGNPALGLGLATSNTGNSNDLVITTTDGVEHGVTFGASVDTLGEVLSAITAQTGGRVTGSYSDGEHAHQAHRHGPSDHGDLQGG